MVKKISITLLLMVVTILIITLVALGYTWVDDNYPNFWENVAKGIVSLILFTCSFLGFWHIRKAWEHRNDH